MNSPVWLGRSETSILGDGKRIGVGSFFDPRVFAATDCLPLSSVLLLLGTVPKYERRGAGGLLIRWPFERADRDGKRCYVDASPIGYQLYKRCGFSEDVGEMSLDLNKYEPGSGLGTMKWVAMMREPQSK